MGSKGSRKDFQSAGVLGAASSPPVSSRGPSSMKIRQWVDRVTRFSSEYDDGSWCADCITGPPRVFPKYGDTPGAWASESVDNNQFIELRYKEAVYIEQINIYETYNAGGVKRVKARRNGDADWMVLWETPRVECIQRTRVFSPPIRDLGMKCSDVRIDVDCSAAEDWVEIDAVQIVGLAAYLPAPPSMEEFADNLSILVNNETFSDVQFEVGDRKVYAHKAILMARSDYFKAMFCDQMKETVTKDPILLKDVEFEGFSALLHFLYTNQIPSLYQSKQLVQIWRDADRFSVEGLKTMAAYQVCNTLDSDNVVDVYCEAANNLPVIDEIRESCVEYMRGHMSSIVKTPPFVDLDKDIMSEIIRLTNNMNIN